ncbi:DUF167 family protein [Alcanivorax sp. 1008]|uniref:DUF167 family protein n=1 Tax=Alcanivorax sp. 1008 TaxID=2816853 RepID=UPI001D24CFCE|nr:DUF167 family protein [Alcanivorax sp. 1008]MCC1498279.1 YggU family protein [Alcanivorax sp. 1008]
MSAIRRQANDWLLDCWLQPRGGRDAIIGLHDDAVKIRIGAPPVDGAANLALIRFIADEFGVSQSSVILESGQTSRRKRLRVRNASALPASLAGFIAGA